MSNVICDHCGATDSKKRCTKCRTRYCSKECQRSAWPTHKLDCSVRAVVLKANNTSSILESLNDPAVEVEFVDSRVESSVESAASSLSNLNLQQSHPQPQPQPQPSLLTPSSVSLKTCPPNDERQSFLTHQYPHPAPPPHLINLEEIDSPVKERKGGEDILSFEKQKAMIIKLLTDDPVYSPTPTYDSKNRCMLPGPWFRSWLTCVSWSLPPPPSPLHIPALNYTLEGFEQIEPRVERPGVLDYTVLLVGAGKLKGELVTFYDFYPVKGAVCKAFENWYGVKGTPTTISNTNGQWNPTSPPTSQSSTFTTCSNCGGEGYKRCSSCKKVHYCSKSCQEHHWQHYHEAECGKEIVENKHKPGLTNLGNSCYMNSALQCVMHSQEVRRVFLSGDWKGFVNKENWESTGGKLAGAFCRLINQYYGEGEDYISPIDFKKVVGKCDKEYGFGGLRQHDCTEFIIWLLDRMHEDLNVSQIPKPYVEFTDSDGTNSAVASRVNHEKCLLRDNSELSRAFGGQWQSTCICPVCKNVSVKFEPFNTNTLEVKTTDTKTTKPIHVYLFRKPGEGKRAPKPVELYVEVPKGGDLSDVRKALPKKIDHIRAECMVLADVYQNNFYKFMNDGVGYPSANFEDTDEMAVYECQAPVNGDFTVAAIVQTNQLGTPLGWPVISDLKRTDTCKQIKDRVWKLFRRTMGKKQNYLEGHQFYGLTEAEISAFGRKKMNLYVVEEQHLKGGRDGSVNLKHAKMVPPDDSLIFFEALEGEDGKRKKMIHMVVVWRPEWMGIMDENELNDKVTHESCSLDAGGGGGRASLTLDGLFTMQSKPERLDGMYCSHCKDHTKAIKTLKPRRLPNILIITFKRFEIRNGRMTKVKTFVDFPINNLDMSKHSLAHNELEKGAMAGGPVSAMYDLFGVVQHYGNAGYGHYTSCCRAWEGRQTGVQGEMEDEWWLFDDNSVTKVAKKEEIVNEFAYALFYRRKVYI